VLLVPQVAPVQGEFVPTALRPPYHTHVDQRKRVLVGQGVWNFELVRRILVRDAAEQRQGSTWAFIAEPPGAS
jgi:hypothetical protein